MDLSGSMQGTGGVGGLLAVTEHGTSSAEHFYPTYDGNGNISEYLDATSTTVAHYEYDTFGNTTVSTGSKVADFVHRFSTKPLDAETGLYYYGYRYYDPVTGRWPSRDPLLEKGGMNIYGFVGNQPISRFDMDGRVWIAWQDADCMAKCGEQYLIDMAVVGATLVGGIIAGAIFPAAAPLIAALTVRVVAASLKYMICMGRCIIREWIGPGPPQDELACCDCYDGTVAYYNEQEQCPCI